MAPQSMERLPEAIRRYAEVAEGVNHREMKRFIAEIRSKWHPQSHEEHYRYEGWTDEGALTKCVYEMALPVDDRPPPVQSPDVTQAEYYKQVQNQPGVDEIMNFVQKPLILPPLAEDSRRKLLDTLKTGLKQQATDLGVDATALELPEDLETLFSIVKGINGAGVPSETAFTKLVYPMEADYPPTKAARMPSEGILHSERGKKSGRPVPIAALRLGGCRQHRSIFYVLSELESSTQITSNAIWQIWDRIDIDVEEYANLADWLEHETEAIEEDDMGGARVVILMYDSYPV